MLQEKLFTIRRKDGSLGILNRIDETKFHGFAKRVICGLKSFDSSFTEDEISLLVKSVGISSSEITEAEVVLRAAFLQAVRQRQTPELFAGDLRDELQGRRADLLEGLWAKHSADLEVFFGSLPTEAKQVERIEHQLAVTIASSRQRAVTRPVSTLQFHLAGGEEPFTVEFDHAGLKKFHEKLEEIQRAVDTLTS